VRAVSEQYTILYNYSSLGLLTEKSTTSNLSSVDTLHKQRVRLFSGWPAGSKGVDRVSQAQQAEGDAAGPMAWSGK